MTHRFEDRSAIPASIRQELALLTAQDVAALLKVQLSWVYDRVESGEFPCVKLGRQLRFRPEDVRAYLDERYRSSRASQFHAGDDDTVHRGVRRGPRRRA